MDSLKKISLRNTLLAAMAVWLLAGSLTGCSPTRQLAGGSAEAAMRRISSPLAGMAQPLAGHTDITMRMALNATVEGKTLPLKGTLRMYRGEVIQLSLTAMGLVEIARMEAAPDAVYIIDRLGKQYAVVSYSSIPGLGNTLLDYSLIESLLWNELFIPGQKSIASNLQLFTTEETEGGQQLIYPKTQKMLACRFWADKDFTRLQKMRLQLGQIQSDWEYKGYQTFGNSRYPTSLTANVMAGGRKATADFTFTNLTLDTKDWQKRTNLSNYRKVSVDVLLSKLKSF